MYFPALQPEMDGPVLEQSCANGRAPDGWPNTQTTVSHRACAGRRKQRNESNELSQFNSRRMATPSAGLRGTGLCGPDGLAVQAISSLDLGQKHLVEIIGDLKRGFHSDEHFRWLFERYHRLVLRSFIYRGIPYEDSRDLAQEVFLAAFRSIHDLQNAAQFPAWLFSIGRNTLRNEVKRQRTKKRFGLQVSSGADCDTGIIPGLDNPPDDGPQSDSLTLMLDRERLSKVREALRELPPQMSRCALLRIVEDRTYAEIAAIMSISINTVKAHLYQAKQILKDRLKPYFYRGGPSWA